MKRTRDGRSHDLSFSWLTERYGPEWEEWRQYVEQWLNLQEAALSNKRDALTLFFERYCVGFVPYTASVCAFFEGTVVHRCSTDELKEVILRTTNRTNNTSLADALNHAFEFMNWVIATHFTERDEKGIVRPLFDNPLERVKRMRQRTETVHSPLPYRFVTDLRNILCPKENGHFKDWQWAIEHTLDSHRGGDWFDVDPAIIDKDDPNCVWRQIQRRYNDNRNRNVTVHQLWSPVKSVALLIRLHLPIRSYQVRMLDSGEADTWRYDNGQWTLNTAHPFVIGTESAPVQKGVFRRYVDNDLDTESTGLYINTNKTADQNKDEYARGYVIPWQNEPVLYWLNQLRRWQEKYNPISGPVDCTTLKKKHTGEIRSQAYLANLGHLCFLFRDAAAKSQGDRTKPIPLHGMQTLWYRLLHQLEVNHNASGGKPITLVYPYPKGYTSARFKTYFPLHSLRVSLITSYAMDGHVPLPVIAKLLAGHSRLLMTVYYTKITPAVMREKMTEAHRQLDAQKEQGLRRFLADAEIEQIKCKTVYHHEPSIEAVLVNRNPAGWENRHIGLCMVGGNTVRSDETSTICGCWNGGELVKESADPYHRIYGPVPNGPENCVRCRWFVTDARYLAPLNAHLNVMSYKATDAAKQASAINQEVTALTDQKYRCEKDGRPFTEHHALQALQRRYEKQLAAADEYTKDWIATLKLIRRIMAIENDRAPDDDKDKLVSVGTEQDLQVSIQYLETDSELLQLSLICQDAEIYPDLFDELHQTSAIHRIAQLLSRVMMRSGYQPVLLQMDEPQMLAAVNALLRQMAKTADPNNRLSGFRKVADYLDTDAFCDEPQWLASGIEALQTIDTGLPITLNQLRQLPEENRGD